MYQNPVDKSSQNEILGKKNLGLEQKLGRALKHNETLAQENEAMSKTASISGQQGISRVRNQINRLAGQGLLYDAAVHTRGKRTLHYAACRLQDPRRSLGRAGLKGW